MKRFALALTTFCCLYADTYHDVYVGLDAGLVISQAEHRYTNAASAANTDKDKSFYALAGLHLGYLNQLQNSHMVVGLEGFVDMTTLKSKGDLKSANSTDGHFTVKINPLLGATVSFGPLLNQNFMLYLKTGYVLGMLKMSYSNLSGESPSTQEYKKATHGALFATGAKYKISHNTLLGAEVGIIKFTDAQPRKITETVNGTQKGFHYKNTPIFVKLSVSYLF